MTAVDDSRQQVQSSTILNKNSFSKIAEQSVTVNKLLSALLKATREKNITVRFLIHHSRFKF